MTDPIQQLTDSDFDTQITASPPILVDFWAAWCAPCKMIGPILEELAREYAGRLRVGKLNVDENTGTASRYGVRSIPTLILFTDGRESDRLVGAAPKESISRMMDKHL
ncbi:MAG: thioredoxin [Acidobacteriota bacterium]